MIYNTTVKLNLCHNISSNKMLDIRFDLGQSVYSVKEQIEKRYGTNPDKCELILQDREGNNISNLADEHTLSVYQPQDGYWIHILDLNPHSILNQLEDVSQVEKYKMSNEDYNNLPSNFKKFRQKLTQQQKDLENNGGQNQNEEDQVQVPPVWDQNYLKEFTDAMEVGQRCQLIEKPDQRGTIKYIGKIPNAGSGYFVGIQLDLPYGNNDGKYLSVQYFECTNKYGIFLRPNKIEVGDFPEEDLDDLIDEV